MEREAASPLEQLLVQFWDDTLGTARSDRLTDFFRPGGGDAEAERLLTLVEDALHVEMPLAVLRAAPTVATFAEALKHQVDHPGRLERLAERLLHHGRNPNAAQRGGHRAGASW